MPDFSFDVTDSAKQRIAELLKSEPLHSKFRIKVLGGGCSGFQYDYIFDSTFDNEDIFFSEKLVVIDKMSLDFMQNSVLDFVEDLGKAEFVIKNPNTIAKCGCGKSFAV